jgi:hypothetical protein
VHDMAVQSGGQYIVCRTPDGVRFIDHNGRNFHVIKYPGGGLGAVDIRP